MKQELIDMINASEANEAEKQEMALVVEKMDEDVAESLLELAKKNPQFLAMLVDFYKRKKAGFATMKEDPEKGQEILDKVYEEEAEQLNNLIDN